MIDLCKCKPGDYLIARDGRVLIYLLMRKGTYPHKLLRMSGTSLHYPDNGKYFPDGNSRNDILKIIPKETQNIYFTLYENIQLLKRTSSVA